MLFGVFLDFPHSKAEPEFSHAKIAKDAKIAKGNEKKSHAKGAKVKVYFEDSTPSSRLCAFA